jgi:predicted RNA-binding protein (virulence factor B family)
MNMDQNLGKIRNYSVLRETQLGYILSDGETEYFLHRNESKYQKLLPGDQVKAFIYSDKQGRLAATLYLPELSSEKVGFARVVDVNYNLGLFLNIGISKDVLLSRDDLPEDRELWPQAEDRLVCRLKVRGTRLLAKLATKDEILEGAAKELSPDEKVNGYVYRITKDGINLVTEDFAVIFVYYTNLRKKYRLGEKVEVKIIRKNDDDYSGTTIEQKEKMLKTDQELILAYLKDHQGVMAITEKSDALVIYRVFNMSKKAFKNALGSLYKERKIEIFDDKIVLL